MAAALERFGTALDAWHGRPVDAWREQWGVPALRIYRSVGSTNDVARAWAEAGVEAGATVLADAQPEGRGRRGRVWRADPGQSLILSMVVRPDTAGAEAILPLRLGLAAARAIEEVAPVAVGIKWPNDLVIAGRKVGGMLCEGTTQGRRPLFVVAGTGINVLQPDDAWAGQLAGRATSLAAQADRPVAVPPLVGRVLARWLAVLDAAADALPEGEMGALAERDVLAGRAVTVDGAPAGVARGIAPDGRLAVVDGEGRTQHVRSGTVRAADTDGGAP